MTNFIPQKKKKVSFQQNDTIITVESYLDYSSSIWYSQKEYRSFSLEETREQLSGPPSLRKVKRERSLRKNDIRRLVIEAQFIKFKGSEEYGTGDKKAQWLANFYTRHSGSFVIEARQRGIENDLELLNIKLREASSAMLKRSALFKTLTVSKTNNNNNTNNARWSDSQGVIKLGLGGAANSKDRAPIAVKSSSHLRRELCKDFDLNKNLIGTPFESIRMKQIDRHWSSEQKQHRWSAVPIQNKRRSVLKRDRPLKDIHPLALRRPSLSKRAALD
uniref:Uncharacterized protein n=1 Tax=Pseudo-nitzschia australis TaxID=44445 RepID=A0A7S4ER06_9STRA|mmetsp:Transcript_13787/g.28951  ORF Transcript_13787/g.28951 Transcript_13787/m.28951 type:complete len:275 (+) Transcript_13787:112-936(+)